MRAKLSVVMPTLNAETGLARSLPALTEGLQAGLIRELVISDGGSTDATLRIAEKAGAEIVHGDASRGGQLRRGAMLAHGEWLLFLHADTVLPSGWVDCVIAQLIDGRPAYFRLKFDSKGLAPRLVAVWANFRSRVLGLPYGDQALLVARSDYDASGGYPEIPLMEDVALVRALKVRPVGLPLAAQTSAARYERDGWVRRGGRNLSLLARYFAGVDPENLVKRY